MQLSSHSKNVIVRLGQQRICNLGWFPLCYLCMKIVWHFFAGPAVFSMYLSSWFGWVCCFLIWITTHIAVWHTVCFSRAFFLGYWGNQPHMRVACEVTSVASSQFYFNQAQWLRAFFFRVDSEWKLNWQLHIKHIYALSICWAWAVPLLDVIPWWNYI